MTAVHQQLLLLWSCSRARRGEARLVRWSEYQAELADLLDRFGHGEPSAPELPVLALRSSGVWELADFAGDAPAARSPRSLRWMNSVDPQFGFTTTVYDLLANDEQALTTVALAAVSKLDQPVAEALLAGCGLEVEVFRGYGQVPDFPVGSTFPSRKAAAAARVHRAGQAGIVGTGELGAESIVVSGGYEDDVDRGNEIIYTGHGGRDPAGKQIEDQTYEAPGNAALLTSHLSGMPVRLVRGHDPKSPYGPADGYRYDGLFVVDGHWRVPGRSGFLICRYRLLATDPAAPSAPGKQIAPGVWEMPTGNPNPGTRQSVVNQVVRSTAVKESVKNLYGHRCQVCETRLDLGQRGYSQGAHIRPLAGSHDGPDVPSNVLCLCPNCHVLFDNGAILIADDFTITAGQHKGKPLTVAAGHDIDAAQLRYHRGIHR